MRHDKPRQPAHIAFMAIPAHGHVNPGLGLVTELVERGHRVTYAITEEFDRQIKETGATPVFYRSVLPSPSAPDQAWPADLPEIQQLFLDEAMGATEQLEAAYAGDRPDLIVYDIGGFHAPVLAHRWNIPYLQLSPTHVAFEGMAEEFGVTSSPELDEVHARYDAYLADQGVPLTFDTLTAPPRCIVTIPRSFQYRPESVADTYTFVGPMLTERACQGDWQPPENKPVLLISLGSAYTNRIDFYRTCIEAFANTDWHVVMSIGRIVDASELGEVPANFEIHRWIPQLRILQHADAFITHAGMGGLTEALHEGVPLIAAPQAAEQFANAARIEELGLGCGVDSNTVTASELREAVSSVVSDGGIRDRLYAMREEIAGAGGVQRAVRIVEGLLPLD